MSRAYNRPGFRRFGRAGVTTMEFALIALLFMLMVIASMDLGRYLLITQSLRTVAAEAARAAEANGTIFCQDCPTDAPYTAITPFIDDANLTLSVNQQPGVIGVNQIAV